MIIVTGCDNSGKTSLVRHLSGKFNIPIAPRFEPLPPKTPNDWAMWYKWVKKNLEYTAENLIYDRFFIDELVYGPILRGGYSCSMERMAQLSSMILLRQPLYIYTVIPSGNILSSFEDRKQYPEKDKVIKILERFSLVNGTWPISQMTNKVRFNYINDPNYSEIDLVVGNYLREGHTLYGKRA